MRNLAIIPARGGSKRIPRKNIKPFMGVPIIEYSIRTALECGLFDEVMVSTDDQEIAEMARAAGAKVPFLRSEKTSNDHAGLADVIDEVVSRYREMGECFDNWCCILSTAPFITVDLLKEGFELFEKGHFDSVRPVVRFSYPIQRAFRKDGRGGVKFMFPEYAQSRSQDLEPAFHDAGLFYWGTVEKGFKGDDAGAFEISERFCQDIDTEEDWVIAELKYRMLSK